MDVTTTRDGRAFDLYSADGTLQASFEGNFRGFALHTPHLVAADHTHSYLYNFDGSLASTFEGLFQEFNPNGESLITQIDQPSQQSEQSTDRTSESHLYGFDGTLQVSMSGEFAAFTPVEANIITDNQQPARSWLYETNGVQTSTFEGFFLSFTPNGRALFTYSNSDGVSHLYSIENYPSGDEVNHFEGMLLGITTDARHLVTAVPPTQSNLNPPSQLYSIDGTKLAHLEGLFVGFTSNEQRIVTVQTSIEDFLRLGPTTYFVYDLAGNLKATLIGQLLGLTQSGRQGLVIYAGGKTRLYDSFDGTQQAVFEGRVLGFTRDETGVFIDMEN